MSIQTNNNSPHNILDTVAKDRLRIIQGCKNTFASDQAKKFLEDLEKLFGIEMPICPPGCPEGTGYYREGQISVFRYFRMWLNLNLEDN